MYDEPQREVQQDFISPTAIECTGNRQFECDGVGYFRSNRCPETDMVVPEGIDAGEIEGRIPP
jgi:hypothetical protein